GRGSINAGSVFVTLKPLSERKLSADQVMARLRPQLARVPGASLYLQAQQDIRTSSGRASNAQYQFTLQGDNFKELSDWSPRMMQRMAAIPGVVDLSSSQQDRGLQASLVIDRATASRFGITPQTIDNTLYDAFGQRQVSTLYTQLNQYHVVMEADP